MKYRRAVLLVLLLAFLLGFATTAQAEAPRRGIWGWMMQHPSTWVEGLTSLWQREGLTIDPWGRPGPAPEAHRAGGQGGPATEGEGATIDPAGDPVPRAVYDGVGLTIDPAGEPVAGTEGDTGHTIDPLG